MAEFNYLPLAVACILAGVLLLCPMDSRKPASVTPAESEVSEDRSFTSSPWTFLINVFTYDDLASLRRLLDDLLAADYAGHQVSLRIFVDGDGPDGVKEAVSAFQWPHGAYGPKIYPTRQGLGLNILNSWAPKKGLEGDSEVCFMFEDDVGLSPLFFKWALQLLSWGVNASNDRIAGISFNTQRLNQFMSEDLYTSGEHGSQLVLKDANAWDRSKAHIPRLCGDVIGWTCWGHVYNYEPLRLKDRSVLRMQAPTSSGHLFLPKPWKGFRAYHLSRQQHACLPRSLMKKPKYQKALKIPLSMTHAWPIEWDWKLALAEFMVANALWMAFPLLPNEASFSTAYREKGELRKDHFWEFTVPLLDAARPLPNTSGLVSETPLMDVLGRTASQDQLEAVACAYRQQLERLDQALIRAISLSKLNCTKEGRQPTLIDAMGLPAGLIDAAIPPKPYNAEM